MQLFELIGRDPEIRFSPYGWKTLMALKHKGLEFERIPVRYCDKDRLAFSGQGLVPVIRHDGAAVSDSWKIAVYLESRFAARPPLFGCDAAIAATQFVNTWVDTCVLPAAAAVVALDTHNMMRTEEQAYYRTTREQRFGMSLERFTSDRPARLAALGRELAPMRQLLAKQPFVGGAEPRYGDYCVFGMFMWVRCVSRVEVLDEHDPLRVWRERLLDLFDGFARGAPRSGAQSG